MMTDDDKKALVRIAQGPSTAREISDVFARSSTDKGRHHAERLVEMGLAQKTMDSAMGRRKAVSYRITDTGQRQAASWS